MSSTEMVFRISDRKHARLRNWQRAVEEKIRAQEIETGRTWDGRPIPEEQLEMLKSGAASVHWGYCTEPYSYQFRPVHPNATVPFIGKKNQYLFGKLIRVMVTNNVTGETIDLNEAFSEWDDPLEGPPSRISLLRAMLPEPVAVLRNVRFRFFGRPKSKGPVELGGIPAGSDQP